MSAAGEPIVVVSGLPRSGTSLVMQMLRAGGVSILADDHRPADESNPRGYLEYEPVKWLAAGAGWIDAARGRAVKVIAQLVPFLPADRPYRVLFVRRDVGETLESQAAMLRALGRAVAPAGADLRAVFERQFEAAREFVRRLPAADQTTLDHRAILADPGSAAHEIKGFLGRADLDTAAMAAAVDPSLYRSRRPTT
jgi:hypothetical protein